MKKVFFFAALFFPFIIYSQPSYEHFEKGTTKLFEKDYYGAIEDLSKAIEINPKFIDAYFFRATARVAVDERIKAINDYKKIIEIDPNNADAYYYKGYTLDELGDYIGAIENFSKAIEIDPEFAWAYYGRGYAKIELEDYAGVIEDNTKAIELDSEFAEAYFGRGIARFELGDIYEACSDWKIAYKLGLTGASDLIQEYCNLSELISEKDKTSILKDGTLIKSDNVDNLFYFIIYLSVINLVFGFIWKWISVGLSSVINLFEDFFKISILKKFIILFKSLGAYFYISLTVMLAISVTQQKPILLSLIYFILGCFIILLSQSYNTYNTIKQANNYSNNEMLKFTDYDGLITLGTILLYIIIALVPELGINILTINFFELLNWAININILRWIISIGAILVLLKIIYYGIISFGLIIVSIAGFFKKKESY